MRLRLWFHVDLEKSVEQSDFEQECSQGAEKNSGNEAEGIEESTDISEPVKHAVHRLMVVHDIVADFEVDLEYRAFVIVCCFHNLSRLNFEELFSFGRPKPPQVILYFQDVLLKLVNVSFDLCFVKFNEFKNTSLLDGFRIFIAFELISVVVHN